MTDFPENSQPSDSPSYLGMRPPFGQVPEPIAQPDEDSGIWIDTLPTPRWSWLAGLVQTILLIPITLGASFVGLIIAMVALTVTGSDIQEILERIEADDIPVEVLAAGLICQQLGQGLWPVFVSKVWSGWGLAKDWGFRFKWVDIPIGVGASLGIFVLAGVTNFLVTQLVGLEDPDQANNTQFLVDAKGSPWLFVLIFGAVVGAPITEELVFRGLVLRSFERMGDAASKLFGSTFLMQYGGRAVGVLGSTVLFILPHFTGAGFQGTVVLFSAIGVVGLALGILVVVTRRLGPAIIAHVIFNVVGVSVALLSS